MQITAFWEGLSYLEDSSNRSHNQVFIFSMATANIGMANLERLITFLIL